MATQHSRIERLSPSVGILVAVFAGVLATYAGLRPTGEAHDDGLIMVSVAAGAWAAATAPGWLLTLWCGSMAALSIGGPFGITAALAAIAGLTLWERVDRPEFRSLAAAAGLVGSAWLPSIGRFGNTSLIALVFAGAAVVSGIRRKPRNQRRAVLLIAAPLVAWVAAATIATGAALQQARTELERARTGVDAAVEAVKAGDFATARRVVSEAREAATTADHLTGRRFAGLGRAIPVVAQHRRAAVAVVDSAARLLRDTDRVLQQLPRGQLTGKSGRVDVTELAALADTLARLSDSTRTAAADTAAATESPWLYGPLQRKLREVTGTLVERQDDIEELGDTMRALPGLLGGDRPRRYLVLFITPAEARSLGGFMGSYATIVADDGLISLEHVGRSGDLAVYAAQHPGALVIDGPQSYLDRYAAFGFGGGGQPATIFWWQQFTISPDFPSVAQAAAQVFPQSGGQPVDAVLSLDPHAMAGLLKITGPIHLPSIDRDLDAGSAEQFLSREQYLLIPERGNEARVELLGETAEITFKALLATKQLQIDTLVDALRPEIAGRHLMAWSPDPTEQAAFAAGELDGAFVRPPGDGLFIANTNASGSKIDLFLHRSVDYRAIYDPTTGVVSADVELTLTNEAPTEGLPNYIIGNSVGDPVGSTRSWIMMYTPLSLIEASADGAPITLQPADTGTELGWNYVQWQVVIPSGGTTVLHYRLTGTFPPGEFADDLYRLTVRAQPTARPDDVSVTVTDPSGKTLVSSSTQIREDLVLVAPR